MNESTNISAIILAGGKSSRMGTDKGLLIYKDKPFIMHIISAVSPLAEEILIVGDNPAYDDFGYRRFEDWVKEYGPLAGLYSGLTASKNDLNFVLSCDVPGITTTILERMSRAFDPDHDICLARADQADLPLIAIYRKSCAEQCLNLINSGEQRLMKLIEICKVQYFDIALEDILNVANINTPEQLLNWTHEIDS